MAMNTMSNAAGEPMMDMNTTPLIDVLLVLLILFIVTLPLATHVTRLNLPIGGDAPLREVITLDIDFDGVVAWNGETVDNMEQLSAWFGRAASNPRQPELHVRPASRVEYDHVAQVLARAQRSGLEHIAVVSGERP